MCSFYKDPLLSLWHEHSEVGVSSEASQLVGDVVAGLLTVSESNRDVTVWRGSCLAPDDDGSCWELRQLAGGNSLLSEGWVSCELISSLPS